MSGVDGGLPWGIALVATGAAMLLAGVWRAMALRRGWMDVPVQRSSHRQPTPRGGGDAIAVVLLAWVLLSPWPREVAGAVALSLAGAALVGLVDDLRGLRPPVKLAGQAFASLPLALLGGEAWAAGQGGVPVAATAALVVAVLLFLVNAWNFMDGINGIAALSAAVVGAVAVATSAVDATAAFGVGLVAACAGFLPWNVPRARLFMGDAGSHVLGMAVGVLLVLAGSERRAVTPWALSAACLPFAVDVLGTLARRALDGEPLASAHRRHLYQLMVRCGYSHARVALAYGSAAAILGAGVAMVVRKHDGVGPVAFAVALVLVSVAWGLGRAMLAPRILDGGRA